MARENYPGPGNYMSKTDGGQPSFKFGTERRDKSIKSGTPGPGQYKIPCSIVDVPTFFRNTGGFETSYKFV